MHINKLRLFHLTWLLASVPFLSPAVHAEDATVQFAIAADPREAARDLLFESMSVPLPPTKLADEDDFTGDSISVEVPYTSPPGENAVVRLEWSDGSETSFPIFLSSFTPTGVMLMLFHIPSDDVPTEAQVRDDCTNRTPRVLSTAFEMFFACRAHALRLEQDGQSIEGADAIYRAALAGWLNANYRLYVDPFCRPDVNAGCRPSLRVSPYGADPELVSRLEQIIDLGRPINDWKPLRIPDAVNFLTYVKQRDLQMVEAVQELVRDGRLEEALAINERALDAIGDIGDDNAFRVTEDLLRQNMTVLLP